jgi:hypothetical protein
VVDSNPPYTTLDAFWSCVAKPGGFGAMRLCFIFQLAADTDMSIFLSQLKSSLLSAFAELIHTAFFNDGTSADVISAAIGATMSAVGTAKMAVRCGESFFLTFSRDLNSCNRSGQLLKWS